MLPDSHNPLDEDGPAVPWTVLTGPDHDLDMENAPEMFGEGTV